MLERIDYLVRDGKVTLCRCWGRGSYVDLPGTVEGLAVTALADHLFAPEGSARIPREKLCHLSLTPGAGEGIGPGQGEAQAELSSEVEEVRLPEGLEEIGDYAFYECRRLHRLYLPASLKRLGRGAFAAADHLRELRFGCSEGRLSPPCLKEVLGEIAYEVEAVVEDGQGKEALRLVYPEYYEDSVENTPARIIQVRYEGTGYQYRQCFKGQEPDLDRYDRLFYTAKVQEYAPTVLRMAFARLMTPVGLSSSARRAYLEHLRQRQEETARFVLENDRIDLLEMLIREGYFTGENEDYWLDQAVSRQRSDAVSLLMDRSRPAANRNKYILR